MFLKGTFKKAVKEFVCWDCGGEFKTSVPLELFYQQDFLILRIFKAAQWQMKKCWLLELQ